jgi:hypothetical protein
VFYDEFIAKYIKGIAASADKKVFDALVNQFFSTFEEDFESLYNENTKKYHLDEYQIRKVKNAFSTEMLNSILVKMEVSPISLEKYLTNLELNGLVTEKMSKWNISDALGRDIKSYILEELLFREGFSRGLQNFPEIVSELKSWKESYLASYYKHTFLDSAKTDEAEAKKYFDKVMSENPNATDKSFDELKEKIKSGLYFSELENIYIDKTVNLAQKYGVSVNLDVLNSTNVTNVEMMVYRKLGFGGQITAVPFSQPFFKWKYWLPKSLKQQLP